MGGHAAPQGCFPPVPKDYFYSVPFTEREEEAPVVKGGKGRKEGVLLAPRAFSYPANGKGQMHGHNSNKKYIVYSIAIYSIRDQNNVIA